MRRAASGNTAFLKVSEMKKRRATAEGEERFNG